MGTFNRIARCSIEIGTLAFLIVGPTIYQSYGGKLTQTSKSPQITQGLTPSVEIINPKCRGMNELEVEILDSDTLFVNKVNGEKTNRLFLVRDLNTNSSFYVATGLKYSLPNKSIRGIMSISTTNKTSTVMMGGVPIEYCNLSGISFSEKV